MDKAYRKAENLLGKITKTEEKPDCYIFYNDDMKYDGVVVVMKQTYTVLSLTDYIIRKGKV